MSSDHTNYSFSFFRASSDQDLQSRCEFYRHTASSMSITLSIPEGFIRLEVDGSVLEDGSSGCGGVIRKGKNPK